MRRKMRARKPFSVGDVAHLGGQATREKLTPAQRTAIARAAAVARWAKTPAKVRSEPARKAVLARWAKARTKKSSGVAKKPDK